VPSFVDRELAVEVPGLGRVDCTVAYGGAYYAYVDAVSLGLELQPRNVDEIVRQGTAIKRAVAAACELRHPDGDDDLNFLYGTIFVAPQEGVHSRNVCVFADGEVDRSPTGTGVSGRAAIHHAQGELGDEWITIESILGTRFDVRVADVTEVGGRRAIVPEVRGQAFVTGRAEYWLDPDDPLGEGFLIR